MNERVRKRVAQIEKEEVKELKEGGRWWIVEKEEGSEGEIGGERVKIGVKLRMKQ